MHPTNNRHFLGSEFEDMPASDALFQVIPVPFEATVSYGGGTAAGPSAIIEASHQLEVFDGQGTPGEEGIHTHDAVDCAGAGELVRRRITAAVAQALAQPGGPTPPAHGAAIPVLLGGEHAVTEAAVRAAVERFGAGNVGMVQIDAHADLRDSYQENAHSHACMARRVHQDLGVPIYQLGVRAISPEEILYRSRFAQADASPRIWHIDAAELVPTQRQDLPLPDGFPPYLYLTIDVDGLDPSIMGATGTPVPGGLGWYQTLALITSVARQRAIVGFDLVELAPQPHNHAANFLAADLTYKTMGIVARTILRRGARTTGS